MEPKTYQLNVSADGVVSVGQGVIAAFVPETRDGPAVFALACDPRFDPGRPINELAPAAMSFIHDDLGILAEPGDAGRPVWSVIDGYGRQRGVGLDEHPARCRRSIFSASGFVRRCFFKEAGRAAKRSELLSIVEVPSQSEETPSHANSRSG
jgi:hypothetical protein